MDALRNLGSGVWAIIVLLAGLAVFAELAVPLGHWFWAWAATGQNAMVLIALALAGGVAGFVQNRPNGG